MISDEHQSGVNPLILRRFLDFFNGEKPPPGAAPKRGVGSSNLFWDAKSGRLVRRSEGAFHKPSSFFTLRRMMQAGPLRSVIRASRMDALHMR